MKKLFFLLTFVLSLSAMPLFSQENEESLSDDYIFEHVDLSQIETGILSDYGINLYPLEVFNGELSDSNYVDKGIVKILFLGLHDSQVNNKSDMPAVESVCNKIESSESLNIL